jgi:hypothetical protein
MDTSGGVRSLAQIFLVAAAVGGGWSFAAPARAAIVPAHLRTDGWGNGNVLGNGKHNHNSFIINSPSKSHDIQHIRNVNVGGNTVTPAAICKKSHRCTIIQRTVVSWP